MRNIVTSIICQEFETNVGKWQVKNSETFGMQISFDLSCNPPIEKGYRHLDILIYAPMNYVAVMVKERWSVIASSDLVYDDNGDASIRKGSRGYVEGSTEWLVAGYHDSCWRDSLNTVLRNNEERIVTLDTDFKTWYKKVKMKKSFLDTIGDLTHDEVNRYEVKKNVFKF